MRLYEIQQAVHVAKNKRNEFGGYNYRTAEGILSAIKSALVEGETVVVSDTLQEVAGQIFVTATATITFSDNTSVSAQGHALHPLTKKGMDPSQITGAASSYARKYALGGLVALDDGSVDPDATSRGGDTELTEAEWFAAKLPGMSTPEQINEVIPRAKKAGHEVEKMVADRANELGFKFDKAKRAYVDMSRVSGSI